MYFTMSQANFYVFSSGLKNRLSNQTIVLKIRFQVSVADYSKTTNPSLKLHLLWNSKAQDSGQAFTFFLSLTKGFVGSQTMF